MNVEASGGSQTAAAQPLTPGDWLRRERERRGLSLHRAAEEMRLDVKLVAAIEANRFADLGAPVYAKGHLRKYAALLGLSPDEIITSYQALSDTPEVPTPIPTAVASPLPRERRSLKIPLWVAGLLVAIALGWLVFELLPWGSQEGAQENPLQEAPLQGTTEQTSVPAPVAPESVLQPVNQSASTPASEAGAAAAPAAQGPAPAAQRPAVSAAEAGNSASAVAGAQQVSLRLEFSEPSWTEIYDGSGRRLMFDTGMPGRSRTVRGLPPLHVTVGFASGVSASVNDQSVVIPRRAGRDYTRFSVQADGSVRPERAMRADSSARSGSEVTVE